MKLKLPLVAAFMACQIALPVSMLGAMRQDPSANKPSTTDQSGSKEPGHDQSKSNQTNSSQPNPSQNTSGQSNSSQMNSERSDASQSNSGHSNSDQASSEKSNSNDTNSNQANSNKNAMAKQLSKQATEMLKQVDQAKQAVNQNNTKQAMNDIEQAETQRQEIASMSKSNGGSMIVPLYSELDSANVIGPVLSAKNGQHQPNKSTPVTVQDAAAQFTFVGLDLDKAKSRLDGAKSALQSNNSQAACDLLDAIGNNLVVRTNYVDLPLLAARQNLALAKTAVTESNYKQASAALNEASSDLGEYANSKPAPHADKAKDLQTEVDSLSKNVSQDQANASGKIDKWWDEVNGWFTNPS